MGIAYCVINILHARVVHELSWMSNTNFTLTPPFSLSPDLTDRSFYIQSECL